MKLGELAFACYIFGLMSDYDNSYRLFLESIRPKIDLCSNAHLMVLLKWLNAWGCRQFAVVNHELAANEIKDWYGEFNQYLPSAEATVLTLTEEDFSKIERAYAGLVEKTASYRKLSGERISKETVGPTGTAKILFAIQPNVFIPWDGAMRAKFALDGSNHSYSVFLRKVRNDLEEIDRECKQNNFELKDLPTKLGRPDSSITKLIDEYHWVTITRRCSTPNKEELKTWMDWS
jgi:hypothetical protein